MNELKFNLLYFRRGYFFGVYDLSTSGKCGTNYLIPSIRVGHLRLRYPYNKTLLSSRHLSIFTCY
jgi:hypothetical protein